MAHLVSVIFYFPERIRENPLVLVYIWSGLSSFGGFLGAALAFLYFTRKEKIPALPYADAVALGLVIGWIFGRTGCFTAHDHPGRTPTSSSRSVTPKARATTSASTSCCSRSSSRSCCFATRDNRAFPAA